MINGDGDKLGRGKELVEVNGRRKEVFVGSLGETVRCFVQILSRQN